MRGKKKILVFMAFLFMAMLCVPVSYDYDPVIKPQATGMLAAAPTNTATPVCTNLDDTTHMYPRREYLITLNTSDTDGYVNITTIDFSLLDSLDNSTIWTVRYTNSTDAFSETAGTTLIELVSGSSSAVRAGNVIDLTIGVKIEWAHGDYEDTNVRSTIDDGVTATMDNYTSTNWDIETDLDFSGLTISSTKGAFGATLTIGGTIVFQGSALYPASGDVDVWCAVPTGLTAQSDLTLSSGVFSIATVPSLDSAGVNTYTMTVVAESGGASGTDLCHTTHTIAYEGVPNLGGGIGTTDGPADVIGFGIFLFQMAVIVVIVVIVLYIIVRVVL